MPLSRSRDYMSIGEVLEHIRDEFPDISISKIRFLESEGLIRPERTGSGYRKFYDDDLNRLRYILALQRDHFLPLKVIKERLAEADSNGGAPAVPVVVATPPVDGTRTDAAPDLTGVQMSRDELAGAAGLSGSQMKDLEDFAILAAKDSYDENDLAVAKCARRFFDYGIQARHLKMYRQFADREAAFFEQIIGPLTHRKDPAGRDEASRSIAELATLSRQIKEAALRSNLRELL